MVKKESLRKEVKQKRKLLSEAYVAENSRIICGRLSEFLQAHNSGLDIAGYDTYLLYA